MLYQSVTPQRVTVLLKVRAQYLRGRPCISFIDRASLHHRQQRFGVAHAHPADGGRVAATVSVEGDAHREHSTVGVHVEVGEDAATLQAEAEATWPGRLHRRVDLDLHRSEA